MMSVKYSVFCFQIFVSRGSEHSLWRHHGHENNQLKSAQCQRKASAVSGRHICTVWHSAGILGKCCDIGIDFSGIAAWVNIGSGNGLLPDSPKPLPEVTLTCHQLGSATFIWGQVHKRYLSRQSQKLAGKLHINAKFPLNLPRGQWFKWYRKQTHINVSSKHFNMWRFYRWGHIKHPRRTSR